MIVNLTPHPVAVYGSNTVEDGPRETIAPSGVVARVATIDLGTGLSENSGRTFEWVQYGHVHDLPRPADGTDYLVSLIVALASHRADLLAPYVEVRDEQGTMIGCRYLQRVC